MVLSRRGAPAGRHLFSVFLMAGIISIVRSQENDLFQCPEGMILTQYSHVNLRGNSRSPTTNDGNA